MSLGVGLYSSFEEQHAAHRRAGCPTCLAEARADVLDVDALRQAAYVNGNDILAAALYDLPKSAHAGLLKRYATILAERQPPDPEPFGILTENDDAERQP